MILIIGSSGKLGLALMKAIRHLGREEEFVFHFRDRSRWSEITNLQIFNSELFSLDDLSEKVLDNLSKLGIQSVVCLAGVINVKSNSELYINQRITENCVYLVKKLKVKNLFISSSMAVYGNYKDTPFVENDTLRPTNLYGESKVLAEVSTTHLEDSQINICHLRLGNVMGCDQLTNELNLSADLKLTINKDGKSPIRSYVDPLNLAEIIVSLTKVKQVLPSYLNVATCEEVEMSDILRRLNVKWQPSLVANSANDYIALNTQMLGSLIGKERLMQTPQELMHNYKIIRNIDL